MPQPGGGWARIGQTRFPFSVKQYTIAGAAVQGKIGAFSFSRAAPHILFLNENGEGGVLHGAGSEASPAALLPGYCGKDPGRPVHRRGGAGAHREKHVHQRISGADGAAADGGGAAEGKADGRNAPVRLRKNGDDHPAQVHPRGGGGGGGDRPGDQRPGAADRLGGIPDPRRFGHSGGGRRPHGFHSLGGPGPAL